MSSIMLSMEASLEIMICIPYFAASAAVCSPIHTAQISEKLVTYGAVKHPMPLNRLGMLLSANGYKQVRQRMGKQLCRGWIVYQRNSQEIEAMKHILKQ